MGPHWSTSSPFSWDHTGPHPHPPHGATLIHWVVSSFIRGRGKPCVVGRWSNAGSPALPTETLGCKARARMASLHQWACAESTGLLPDLSAIAQCTGLWSSAVSVELSFCSCVFSRVCFSWLHWGDNLSLAILLKALCWGWLFLL